MLSLEERGPGRSPPTISRELRRNSKRTKAWAGGDEPIRVQQVAERRRFQGNGLIGPQSSILLNLTLRV